MFREEGASYALAAKSIKKIMILCEYKSVPAYLHNGVLSTVQPLFFIQ